MSPITRSKELLFIGLVTVVVAVFGTPVAATAAAAICKVLTTVVSSASSSSEDAET